MHVAKIKRRRITKLLLASTSRRNLLKLIHIGGPTFIGILLLGCMGSYLVPRTIPFSFTAGRSCTANPILLPASLHSNHTDTFILHYEHTVSVAHILIYAGSLCATPVQPPKSDTAYTARFKLSHLSPLGQKVTVQTTPYIHVTPVVAKQPLDLTNNLDFQLSKTDDTFAYLLSANGHTSHCITYRDTLRCPLSQLGVAYGQHYSATLLRTFQGKVVQQIIQTNFTTLTAVSITNSSVPSGSTIYDTPQQFTFQTDKPLVALGSVTLSVQKADGTEQVLPTTASFKDNVITLDATQPLPRKVAMRITIASVKAQDESGLASPYTLSFSVAGGPQVTSTTLTKYDAVADQPITLRFDQPLNQNQNASQISLQADGTAIPLSVAVYASSIVITPQTAYPLCAHLTLSVGQNITNPYGITGDSAYSYTARARCYTTFSIGTSVQGRAITAYQIGSGTTELLFIGTMHGNEQNAGNLLSKWLNDLEVNVDTIPAGRSIVIIPRINPDGAAVDTRVNANGIDLNRNFPATDWQSVVTEPDGTTGPAGGPNPLSEPESQALASYIKTQQPRITVDYHSHAGIVQGNDAGDADALALHYALSSGYSLISSADTSSEFEYSTTGSFEDWTNQSLGLPEFLVELSSPTNDEFSYNRNAMWNLVREPSL